MSLSYLEGSSSEVIEAILGLPECPIDLLDSEYNSSNVESEGGDLGEGCDNEEDVGGGGKRGVYEEGIIETDDSVNTSDEDEWGR